MRASKASRSTLWAKRVEAEKPRDCDPRCNHDFVPQGLALNIFFSISYSANNHVSTAVGLVNIFFFKVFLR